MACWWDEPPAFISIQTIVNGLFVRKDAQPPRDWREAEKRLEEGLKVVKQKQEPKIKTADFWGTDQFPDLKVTFDIKELEERNQSVARLRARREHGLPLQ